MPPPIRAALDQLKRAVSAIEQHDVDLERTPWTEIEKSVIKLLGGAFRVERPEHQTLALGLTGVFAAHLQEQHGAFWFPDREALEGAALGFPDALMVLAPFGAVVEALSRGNLGRLEEIAKQIRQSLSQVRFSSLGPGATKLTPADYQRLFDPGFVQFVAMNPAKAKSTWESTPARLSREIRDALSRLPAGVPPELRKQLEAQLVGALDRLERERELVNQPGGVSRLSELMAHLFASTEVGGAAPEELWTDVILPILLIGVPQRFPPLEQADVAAYQQGADPLLLYVDVVPHQHSAPEEGYLGLFASGEFEPITPTIPQEGTPRLLKLRRERLDPLLNEFHPAKVTDAVQRFAVCLQDQVGKASAAPQSSSLLPGALALLADLKKIVTAAAKDGNELCARQLTEAEALTDGALDRLRQTIQGPRIILTA